MSSSIDLSGTAHLPAVRELREGAALLRKCSYHAGVSIGQARFHWSALTVSYAAPEEHQVHHALDGPCDAGYAVVDAAALAAAALETFAAAADDIRSRRLLLQSGAAELQENQLLNADPGNALAGAKAQMPLSGQLLQAAADQLAQELAAAEDRCIRALNRLAGGRGGAGSEDGQPAGQCLR